MLSVLPRIWKIHLSPVLYVPAVLTTIAFLGKWQSGYNLTYDDVAGLIKNLSLVALAFCVVVLIREFQEGDSKRTLTYLYNALLAGVIFVSVVGILQYFFPDAISNKLGRLYEREIITGLTNFKYFSLTYRVTSIFTSPLVFGIFLTTSLTILLFVGKKKRTLLYIATGLGLVALYFTSARAAIVCLIISVLVMILRRIHLVRAFITTLLLILSFYWLTSYLTIFNINRLAEVTEYIFSGFKNTLLPENLLARVTYNNYIWSLVLTSRYFVFGFPTRTYDTIIKFSPDNQFTAFLVKYGIFGIGLSFWQVILVVYFLILYLRRKGTHLQNTYLALSLVALFGVIAGLTQEVTFLPRLREILFAFMAAATAFPSPNNDIQSVSRFKMRARHSV
jgi:hypothetical protein